MKTNYFLPINSANISQYFSRGIIIPSIKIDGWINDIQSKFSNSILLCSKQLTNETDCSLTIVFSNDELNSIVAISENFFLFNKPLPISRIKSLNFIDEQQSKTTIYNIEKGDAFVPKLVSIVNEPEIVDISELNSSKNFKHSEDWSEKIELYNRVLGGFSLMQFADFPNKAYPKNYFNSLSIINQEVKKQITDFSFDEDYSPYLNISSKKSSIFNKISSDFVAKYAKEKEGFELPIKRGLIKLDEIDKNKNSYLLAILATYGEDSGKLKKSSDFISSIINNNFNFISKEKVCLLFGINQGYSSFKNQYNIQGVTVNTKFNLNSEVDYIIIESVYQYVFNNKSDNTTFPYINEWCPKFNNTIDLQKYETYRVFDKDIIYKKKVSIGEPEYLQELFQRFSKNSMLTPILSILKEQVQKSIEKSIEEIVNKVKSDTEQKLKNNNQFSISQQKEFEKKISELKEQNEKLKNEIENKTEPHYTESNVKESSLNYALKIGIDKNAVINKRKEVLEKITNIGELKGIAKYYGIKSISRFKNDEEDKKAMRKLITEKEEELLS
jgi:hypothetical protein